MDISFAILISAIVAVVGWAAREFARLAQVAQTEKRVGYTKVLEVLGGFYVGQQDSGSVDIALTEFRKMWVYASDNVISKANVFAEHVEGKREGDKAVALGELVHAMREDMIEMRGWRGVMPKIFLLSSSKLGPEDFAVLIASSRDTGRK